MFFSINPEKYMPYEQIDIVEFPDGVGGDQIIEKTFKIPIHYQLREAQQYIQNSVIKEKVIKYPNRAEADRFFNYPYSAIEEQCHWVLSLITCTPDISLQKKTGFCDLIII